MAIIFLAVLGSVMFFHDPDNLRYLFSALSQSLATIIGILITGGIFLSTVGYNASRKESEISLSFINLCRRNVNEIEHNRREVEELFENSKDETLMEILKDLLILEAVTKPLPEFHEPASVLEKIFPGYKAEIYNNTDPRIFLATLRRVSSHRTGLHQFHTELSAFVDSCNFDYQQDLYEYREFLGKKFFFPLNLLFVSFVISSICILLINIQLLFFGLNMVYVLFSFTIVLSIFSVMTLFLYVRDLFAFFQQKKYLHF